MIIAGMGIRMIINLGLHLDSDSCNTSFSKKKTLEETEIRRRLFWGAFVSEKLQSLYLGRPFLIHESDIHVPKVCQIRLTRRYRRLTQRSAEVPRRVRGRPELEARTRPFRKRFVERNVDSQRHYIFKFMSSG